MLRFILGGGSDHNKENDTMNSLKNNELQHIIKILADLVSYMGKSKLDLENKIRGKDEQEMSEYEKQLQKLEAQIREHIRVFFSFGCFLGLMANRLSNL